MTISSALFSRFTLYTGSRSRPQTIITSSGWEWMPIAAKKLSWTTREIRHPWRAMAITSHGN